ncbi:IS1182 family transposase [Facklamia hominis]|uniref:IS1182 family transposase n=1 Tax=Facklamia hominis TaxID=178214 RepID=UPI00101C3224|nr:IS1182 family transposase [Facklamia hominis]RYC97297.1 IS1182 family transposase [Facklamia hominis]
MYTQYNMNQLFLPLELSDLIEPNHIVFKINDFIEQMDTSFLNSFYQEEGRPAYHPLLMIKALLFAYTEKTFSGRAIEKMMRENIPMKWLVADTEVSYRTINRFRSSDLCSKMLESVYVEFKQYLLERSLISNEHLFIDGTKIEANANKYSFVWKKATDRFLARLKEKEIDYYRNEILPTVEKEILKDEVDSLSIEDIKALQFFIEQSLEEVNDSIENWPQVSPDPRKQKRRKLKKHLRKIVDDFLKRELKYAQYYQTFDGRNSFSKTDPDATFMRMKEDPMLNGQLKPGYNLQIATENQFVLAYEIYPNPTDTKTLLPFVEGMADKPSFIVADAGYGSQENLERLDALKINHIIKYNQFDKEQTKKHQRSSRNIKNWKYDASNQAFCHPDGTLYYYHHTKNRKTSTGYETKVEIYYPLDRESAPQKSFSYNRDYQELKEKESAKLLSQEGSALFSCRKKDVEPVFGQFKQNLKFRRTHLRGKEKVNTDIGLVLMANNLIKVRNRTK